LQAQAELTHVELLGHTVPQAPQLLESDERLTQAPLQSVNPVAHWVVQTPLLHTWLTAHAVPHEPQFDGSLCVEVHVPLQEISPCGH
jgi:hypothetical protein